MIIGKVNFDTLKLPLLPPEEASPSGRAIPSESSLPHSDLATTVVSRLQSFMPAQVSTVQTLPARGRRNNSLPPVSLGRGLISRYAAEKLYGIRRQTGAAKLKRLTTRHYHIIARHLSGERAESIANGMGLSLTTISRVLNDPLAQDILKRSYKDRQAELDALVGEAIDSVRHAFQNGSTSERLAAVDKYTKLKQAIAPETNPMATAEDYARAIVQGNQNVQVNIGVSR
jgi:hypothetical protein